MSSTTSARTAGMIARSFCAGFNACQNNGIGETSPKDTAKTVEEVVEKALAKNAEPKRKSIFTYSV